jgi:hypothetical protein
VSIRRTTRTAGRKKKEVFGQKKTLIRDTPTAPPSRPFLPANDRTGMATVSTRDAVALPMCKLVMRADLSAVQLCLNSCFLLPPDRCHGVARLIESLLPCGTTISSQTSVKRCPRVWSRYHGGQFCNWRAAYCRVADLLTSPLLPRADARSAAFARFLRPERILATP